MTFPDKVAQYAFYARKVILLWRDPEIRAIIKILCQNVYLKVNWTPLPK